MRKRHRTTRLISAVTAIGALISLTPAVAWGEQAAAGLSRFYSQRITWAPCDRPVPPGLPDDFWREQWAGLDCGTVLVPMDYRDPRGRALEVVVTRVKAKDPAKRQGSLLLNPGGPGVSGVFFPKMMAGRSALVTTFDLIGFNPRGTKFNKDELDCATSGQEPTRPTRPTDAQFAVIVEQARQRERGCQEAGGELRRHISTANTARDMDVIRAAMDERKINYLGMSYGTYLGAVYGSLFPAKLDRSVLDSSMHPDWSYHEASKAQSVAIEQSVAAWTQWAAEHHNTYRLGTTAQQVRATVEELREQLARTPAPWVGGPPDQPFVDGDLLDMIIGNEAPNRPSWDVLARLVIEFQHALTSNALPQDTADALKVLLAADAPTTNNGVFDTVTCERDWPTDLEVYYRDMRLFRERYPYGEGAMSAAPSPCTFRSFTPPERPVNLHRRGYPTGLVVQAEFDPATKYEGGPAMARELRDHLITVVDDGSHGLYGRNDCVTRQVDDYLTRGVLPPKNSTCAGAPRPDVPTDRPGELGGSLAEQVKSLAHQDLPLSAFRR